MFSRCAMTRASQAYNLNLLLVVSEEQKLRVFPHGEDIAVRWDDFLARSTAV